MSFTTKEQKSILENEDEGEEYDELLDELNDEGFDLVGERVGDPDVTYEIIEE